MGKEIEVKVLNVDLNKIEQKLKEIGAKLVANEYQVNTIFDSEDKYIQNKLNSYLRIRETKNLIDNTTNINFTLKKSIDNRGTRKNIEITTSIDNKEALISILKDLRYNIVQEGYKERKSYVYDGIRFDLDRWDKDTYPYPYMEIEVKEEEDIERAINLLNIDRANISTKSITELRAELIKKSSF